jgi:hypothetical protein
MAKTRNPLLKLVLMLAALFTITASGYAVLTFRGRGGSPVEGDGLVGLLDRYGLALLLIQLAALAIAVVLTILTDGIWSRNDVSATGDGNECERNDNEDQTNGIG